MLDINVVGRRTGVEPGDPAVALAEKIMKLSNLKLRGIHGYSGRSAHVEGFEERKAHSLKVMAAPLDTLARLKKAGIPVEIMSGGSTGTYNIGAGGHDGTAGGLVRFYGRGLSPDWRTQRSRL